jgi:DNA-binding transcriptional MocR family regulator
MATPLMAEIATRWLEDGTARKLLLWQRDRLRRRNELADRMFMGLPCSSSSYGLHVWLALPAAWHEDSFVAHARHFGVAVAGGANFVTDKGEFPPAVRICLGAGTEADLERGLSIIARLSRSKPETALLAI